MSPVGQPSNPNPAWGTTNIPITGVTLSWENGVLTINVEVWFGEEGSMIKVYDGPAITSWNTDSLQYSTIYNWRIICKDTICGGAYGNTWMFTTEQDPNLVNLFCDNFETGDDFWTITNDGGTCVWDISTLARPYTMPPTASGNVFAADEDICGNGTTLLSTATLNTTIDLSDPSPGISYIIAWIEFDNDWRILQALDEAHIEASSDGGITWAGVWDKVGVDSRNSHETAGITSFIGQSSVLLRLRSVQPSWDWWWAVDNFCVYAELATPVELISFTADVNEGIVNLNWSTSTETNNLGFEIERTSPPPSPYQGEGGEAGRGWERIGFVEGKGTTIEMQNYSFIDKPEPEKYKYRLKQIDFDGSFEYSSEIESEVKAPNVFSLEQNYPNPFNPSTRIKYSIPDVIANEVKQSQLVTLKVYDILGKEVATLVKEEQTAGTYEVEFNTSSSFRLVRNLVSGIYFYKLKAGQFVETKKMILLK
jgi:hypothetical protein